MRIFASISLLICLVLGGGLVNRSVFAADTMHVTIDARELPRKLLLAQIELPLSPQAKSHRLALWYPKWVPGSHGPGGPVENLAGLIIEDGAGNLLTWKRTPGEVYRLEVDVPPGTEQLRIELRYITNQPSVNSMGHDSWGSDTVGVISPNTVLLYPESSGIRSSKISSEFLLPIGWQAATALPPRSRASDDEAAESQASGSQDSHGTAAVSFAPVSLETFVDSPLMCGPHYQVLDLVEAEYADSIPPHRLHVFRDQPVEQALDEEILAKLRAMVTETYLLTGSHPFDQFDVLLGLTDALPANGLEHSQSTLNVLPPRAVASASAFRGWNRLLIPHEYLHAWCGKYRRPAGMATTTFHEPKDTELLWVYEGLTQYLGELIEARSGLMTDAQFRHRLVVELRNATYQQGRKWRSLADTGAAAHILRARSDAWPGLRRSQDFYMEGMLFWLEADAILRAKTEGEKSLDDFCRKFFQVKKKSPHPNPYTRRDVVRILQALHPYDWDGLIARRVESLQTDFDPNVASLLGYRFVSQPDLVEVPADTFRNASGFDLRASLGASFSNDGLVRDLLLGSPADKARLRPDMRIIAVADRKWSTGNLEAAIVEAQQGTPIELHVLVGEQFKTIQLHYYAGPRAWNLVRDEERPDLLEAILQPLAERSE
ncbi:hypothetical protein SH139x_000258 [Planctomycetaceae bacterium SH139]